MATAHRFIFSIPSYTRTYHALISFSYNNQFFVLSSQTYCVFFLHGFGVEPYFQASAPATSWNPLQHIFGASLLDFDKTHWNAYFSNREYLTHFDGEELAIVNAWVDEDLEKKMGYTLVKGLPFEMRPSA
jgi:hypothetical protein